MYQEIIYARISMKIIGFNASPRKNGSTSFAVDHILKGAAERGAETQLFHFGTMDIGPCRGCLACKKGDRGCILMDDMQQIYPAIEQADALVLGAPVYMGQMNSQAKIFVDRLFAQVSPRFSPHYKERAVKKKLVLVFTQGNPDASRFQPYYDYTRKMFEILEFDVKDVFVVTGTRTEPASAQTGLDTLMKRIGSALALV